MTNIWRDITAHSKNETDKKPRTWRASYGHVIITITRGHLAYPGEWVMHCPALQIDTRPLGLNEGVNAAIAQAAALDLALLLANSKVDDLKHIQRETKK